MLLLYLPACKLGNQPRAPHLITSNALLDCISPRSRARLDILVGTQCIEPMYVRRLLCTHLLLLRRKGAQSVTCCLASSSRAACCSAKQMRQQKRPSFEALTLLMSAAACGNVRELVRLLAAGTDALSHV